MSSADHRHAAGKRLDVLATSRKRKRRFNSIPYALAGGPSSVVVFDSPYTNERRALKTLAASNGKDCRTVHHLTKESDMIHAPKCSLGESRGSSGVSR